MKWRAYFFDGRKIGSHEAQWEQISPTAMIAAVVWMDGAMTKPQVEVGTPFYWNEGGCICRVWDPHLYTRKLGLVKYGRFDHPEKFRAAWHHAIRSICPPGYDLEKMYEKGQQAGSLIIHLPAESAEPGPAWWLYYDTQRIFTSADGTWAEAPSDGVMVAGYRREVEGVLLLIIKRRYTYYFWHHGELVNTEDMGAVLEAVPSLKRGITSFDGLKSYEHYAQAIAAAIGDDLMDVL